MSDYIDMHTHTLVSGHAYSTIKEMAMAASVKKMTHLGISEHAPAMPGTCNELYFANLKIMPRQMFGVNMLYGVEANIVDYTGMLDLRPGIMKRLDYVIASLHIPCIKPGTEKENTAAIIGAIKNPLVTIIGHPDDDRYPIDKEEVVACAAQFGKIIELNNSSLTPTASRVNAYNNVKELLPLCERYNVPVLIGSDAHYEDYVGEFELAEKLIEEIGFDRSLILNTSFEKMKKHMNLH